MHSAENGRQRAEDVPMLDSHVANTLSDEVLRERERAYNTNPGPEHPIVVRDLRKVFPGREKGKTHVAVSNMSLAIAEGECFGCACQLLAAVAMTWHLYSCMMCMF